MLDAVRSILFAPGNDQHKLERALESGCDLVVADFEDAVGPNDKSAARLTTTRVFREMDRPVLRGVRINALASPFALTDLATLEDLSIDTVVVPKATPEAIRALRDEGPPIIAIVETPRGVRLAYETAAAPSVGALMLGAVDLGLEVGLEARPDGQELLYARSTLAFATAEAGIGGPFDTVYVDIRDAQGLEQEATLVRSLGFQGKACVHPGQVPVINGVFTPSAEDLERAAAVVRAYEEAESRGQGVVALDGLMIDLPVAVRARRLLRAQAGGETAAQGLGRRAEREP